MLICDGHLDLAGNALLLRRDLTQPVEQIRREEAELTNPPYGTAMVSLPAMRSAGVRLAVCTLLARAKPWIPRQEMLQAHSDDWPHADMAHAIANAQLAYYRRLEARGEIRLIRTAEDLPSPAVVSPAEANTEPIGVILTMEGADPIVDPDDLHRWHEAGLRTLMLAHFGRSRYAHGTPAPPPGNEHDIDGPLTPEGLGLLKAMADLAMPLDLSHLSDTSFFQATEVFGDRIYSSHAACRALRNVQRAHTDEMLRLIVQRGGVVGLALFNHYLTSQPLATLSHAVQHIDHICQLAGSSRHAAIGSDLDGGFGVERSPQELDTIADLPRLADELARRGYADADIRAVFYDNWRRFFSETLPAA